MPLLWFFTFTQLPDNTFQGCPVCFWEDDGLQLSNKDLENGANNVSLNQAKINFKLYGAIEERFLEYVRSATDHEK